MGMRGKGNLFIVLGDDGHRPESEIRRKSRKLLLHYYKRNKNERKKKNKADGSGFLSVNDFLLMYKARLKYIFCYCIRLYELCLYMYINIIYVKRKNNETTENYDNDNDV